MEKKKHIETGESESMCRFFIRSKTGIRLFSGFCFERVCCCRRYLIDETLSAIISLLNLCNVFSFNEIKHFSLEVNQCLEDESPLQILNF